jgi:hypothetical protein
LFASKEVAASGGSSADGLGPVLHSSAGICKAHR